MNCAGMMATNPICLVSLASSAVGNSVADSAFTHIAGYFGLAAQNATQWLWQTIDSATTLDLRSAGLKTELAATGAIAVVLCLGLFLIQVITSAVRREAGGLGRALSGLVVSFVGSALALATTQTVIAAVDALSAGFVQYTMHTNVTGLGARLAVTQLAGVSNPAVSLLLSVVIIAAVVIVWAAMMIRKVMLLIAAVLAPLAFSGATADITRGWVRKWIEFVAAMVASKLLLVIILSIGVAVVDGAGQSGSGVGQGATQLAGGALVLLLGGLSPWVAVRMFHFAGDTLYAAHATAGQAATGARSIVAAPQKVAALQAQTRSLRGGTSSGGRLPEPQPPASDSTPDSAPRPGPPPTPGGNGAAGAVGPTGAAAAGAPAAPAAGAPAAPALAAAAAVARSAARAGTGAVRTATGALPTEGDGAAPARPNPVPPKRNTP